MGHVYNMNEELRQETDNSPKTDKPWLFKKGQSGNPGGRPKGKTLKQYTREMLAAMSEEERQEYLHGLPKDIIWRMAEGQPKQETEHSGNLTISQVLDQLENGQEIGEQNLEDK